MREMRRRGGQDPENDALNPNDIEQCNIRSAYYPKPMIPHSFCSPELAAHIIYEKFAKAVPLYRQQKDFTSKGIPLLRSTMSEWVCMIAERWCLPILEEMHRRLLLAGIIHADETVLQVLLRRTGKPRLTLGCGYTATVK